VAGEGGALVVLDPGLGRGGRYNHFVLQRQQNPASYPSAARRRGAEKPRLGVSSRNPALHRGFSRCKSNTALGLRAGCAENRVGSFYRGEQYDSDLGLYYLRARYYNPATGRFLSRDPLDGNAIDPQSLHKYLYAGGDPVNRLDPSGRAASIETIFTTTVIATPTEVGLVAIAGGTAAQIAAWAAAIEQFIGIAYLTTQDIMALIADIAVTRGIAKTLFCGTGGFLLGKYLGQQGATDAEKWAAGLAFSYVCGGAVPLPGPKFY
jgi:RHS repeat-associated protein